MKVTIILIGKTNEAFLSEGISHYLGRLKHYIKTEWIVLQNVKQSASMSKEKLKIKEAEMLLSKLNARDFVILLDEKGKQLTSSALAEYLLDKMDSGSKSLVFVIGGAFGVEDTVKNRANFVLALSKMTFSHQMVRLILAEQLYRAMTIIKGEKYHHE